VITIDIDDPDRGERKVFNDDASAVIWLQDEIARWEKAFGPTLKDAAGAFAEPLRAWRVVRDNIDGVRRRNNGRGSPADYHEDDVNESLVLYDSNVGRSLIFVLNKLGEASANSAAISARLAHGDIEWSEDAAFRGVMLFERVKQASADFQSKERERLTGVRVSGINDQIETLTGAITKLDQMVASIAGTASQQREQIDAELMTYKAEATENLRKLIMESENIGADLRSALLNSDSQLTAATQAAQSKVDTWIAAQDEQRQLEKPAQLWAVRARKHLQDSNRWRNWSIGVGIGGLVLAVFIAVRAFEWSRPLFEAAIMPGTAASAKANAGTLRPTFHYELIFTGATTLAWLTMYLWAMRLLVRLYTTEHHLAIDASARGAMMEAYLGLIEADAANAADRPIVLQALFRPVQDGMVRDDGSPGITPAALLSAIASSQGKAS
jgi:hypothetical protein